MTNNKDSNLFTEEQLETIYRSVKTEYQKYLAKTLSNWGITLKEHNRDKQRMAECKEIMRIINTETGNLVDEL